MCRKQRLYGLWDKSRQLEGADPMNGGRKADDTTPGGGSLAGMQFAGGLGQEQRNAPCLASDCRATRSPSVYRNRPRPRFRWTPSSCIHAALPPRQIPCSGYANKLSIVGRSSRPKLSRNRRFSNATFWGFGIESERRAVNGSCSPLAPRPRSFLQRFQPDIAEPHVRPAGLVPVVLEQD